MIELMVVILIIGILIAIALPSYLGARERAANRANQANLRTGLAAAMTYFAELGSYTGFDVTEAKKAEPTLDWVPAGTPSVDQISIVQANGYNLLIVSLSKSGRYFCLAQEFSSPVTSKGQGAAYADVDTVAECTNGW